MIGNEIYSPGALNFEGKVSFYLLRVKFIILVPDKRWKEILGYIQLYMPTVYFQFFRMYYKLYKVIWNFFSFVF